MRHQPVSVRTSSPRLSSSHRTSMALSECTSVDASESTGRNRSSPPKRHAVTPRSAHAACEPKSIRAPGQPGSAKSAVPLGGKRHRTRPNDMLCRVQHFHVISRSQDRHLADICIWMPLRIGQWSGELRGSQVGRSLQIVPGAQGAIYSYGEQPISAQPAERGNPSVVAVKDRAFFSRLACAVSGARADDRDFAIDPPHRDAPAIGCPCKCSGAWAKLVFEMERKNPVHDRDRKNTSAYPSWRWLLDWRPASRRLWTPRYTIHNHVQDPRPDAQLGARDHPQRCQFATIGIPIQGEHRAGRGNALRRVLRFGPRSASSIPPLDRAVGAARRQFIASWVPRQRGDAPSCAHQRFRSCCAATSRSTTSPVSRPIASTSPFQDRLRTGPTNQASFGSRVSQDQRETWSSSPATATVFSSGLTARARSGRSEA